MMGMTGLAYCSVMMMVMPFLVADLPGAIDDDLLIGWTQAEQRLIEEQDHWLGHQGPADGKHLLLPAAQESSLAVEVVLQPRKEVEDILEVFCSFLLLCKVGPDLQVFENAAFRKDPSPFRTEDHSHPRSLVRL